MSFTIATLTCNDRNSLKNTIDCIKKYTNLDGFTWTIYAQGCSDEFLKTVPLMFENTGIDLRLFANKENEGCSKGFNRLWEYIKDYDFVLNIEDDWYLLEQANTDWLKTCIEYMKDHESADILYMRRYMSDQEKWQYGWNRHFSYIFFNGRLRYNYEALMKKTTPHEYKGMKFQQIPEFMFTNNPCLFRTSSYKKVNIFPIMEQPGDRHDIKGDWTDSSKFVSGWGYAEASIAEKTADLNTFYVNDGMFIHNF
jgi:GT2 family glycosyltransferase